MIYTASELVYLLPLERAIPALNGVKFATPALEEQVQIIKEALVSIQRAEQAIRDMAEQEETEEVRRAYTA